MKIKRIGKKTAYILLPFFVYSILISILMMWKPSSADGRTIYLIFFYFPYWIVGVYVAGFIFGWVAQRRGKSISISYRMCLSLPVFVLTFLSFLSQYLSWGPIHGFPGYGVAASVFSACSFCLGGVVSHTYQKRRKI